jgi:hypothetical protein
VGTRAAVRRVDGEAPEFGGVGEKGHRVGNNRDAYASMVFHSRKRKPKYNRANYLSLTASTRF